MNKLLQENRLAELVNTLKGIRFHDDIDFDQSTTLSFRNNEVSRNISPYISSPSSSKKRVILQFKPDTARDSSLVLPEDKNTATEYVFFLMSQLKPCRLSPSDRVGGRHKLIIGMPGFACKHCSDIRRDYSTGRFFWLSPSIQSKNINILQIFKHIMDCGACHPIGIRVRH